ncbi:FliH/SctL family protein [Zhaonella formicivorans]|uniref:FliH/SctL family protein n=1 Tax=Zhaonella formicivorans TaxID=2528593 RepID=UPI0010EDE83A|nr:FliH/SctL family protein [Zhaonella formicivorans]
MPSSSKVLKGAQITDYTPREIEVRSEFSDIDQLEYDPVVQAKLQWALAESERILSAARAKAQDIFAEAAREKEQIKAEAYREGKEEGYQTGYREGYAAGQAQVNELVEKKAEVLRELQSAQRRLFQEAEESLVALSLEIAQKILSKQVELDPSVVLEVAKTTLREAHAGDTYFLYVNPRDLRIAKEYKEQLAAQIPAGASLQVIADAEIGEGGCRVESEAGFTDGTLESQLAEVAKLLKASIPGEKVTEVRP